MARSRRPLLATAGVSVGLVAVLVAGCSEDAPSPSPTSSLADACTEVLNNRDADVFRAAQEASPGVLIASVGDGVPTERELDAWHDALEAGLAQVDEEIERLRAAGGDAAWDVVVSVLEDRSTVYRARMEATQESWPLEDVDGLGTPSGPDGRFTDALDELDLTGRDCESLLAYPGPTPGHEDFTVSAATTCSAIVERRRDGGYAEARDVDLGIFEQVANGGPVQVSDADVEALTVVRDERQQTVDDLESVDGDPLSATAWEKASQYAQQQLDTATDRLAALESGDEVAITSAYTYTKGIPGWPWEELGLDRRDCRSVDA